MCQRTLRRCGSGAVGSQHAEPRYHIRQLFQDREALGDVSAIEQACADAIIEHARRTCPEALGSTRSRTARCRAARRAMSPPCVSRCLKLPVKVRSCVVASASRVLLAKRQSFPGRGAGDLHRGNVQALHVHNLLGDIPEAIDRRTGNLPRL